MSADNRGDSSRQPPGPPGPESSGQGPQPATRRRRRGADRSFYDTHDEPKFKPEDLPQTEEEWAVPAADARGHSRREWVRMPPVMARAMEVVVGSKAFPYSTINDLMLHGLYRHLFWLHRQDPKQSRTILRQLEAVVEQMRDEKNRDLIKQALESMSERCQAHIDDGNAQEVARIVMQVKALIEDVPYTSHWKKKFLLVWKERATTYLAQSKVVQMRRHNPTSLATLPKPEFDDGTF